MEQTTRRIMQIADDAKQTADRASQAAPQQAAPPAPKEKKEIPPGESQ